MFSLGIVAKLGNGLPGPRFLQLQLCASSQRRRADALPRREPRVALLISPGQDARSERDSLFFLPGEQTVGLVRCSQHQLPSTTRAGNQGGAGQGEDAMDTGARGDRGRAGRPPGSCRSSCAAPARSSQGLPADSSFPEARPS